MGAARHLNLGGGFGVEDSGARANYRRGARAGLWPRPRAAIRGGAEPGAGFGSSRCADAEVRGASSARTPFVGCWRQDNDDLLRPALTTRAIGSSPCGRARGHGARDTWSPVCEERRPVFDAEACCRVAARRSGATSSRRIGASWRRTTTVAAGWPKSYLRRSGAAARPGERPEVCRAHERRPPRHLIAGQIALTEH